MGDRNQSEWVAAMARNTQYDQEKDGEDAETDGGKTMVTLQRFLDIVFADPYRTPLFDEYAMFMAFAAATRSADLSRQIGALIARDEAILATGANECPRAEGGTYWPSLESNGNVFDVPGGRDHMHHCDRNDKEKARIIEDAISAMKKAWDKAKKPPRDPAEWELLKGALEKSTIDDITEYGRPVHAEMDALLTCARNNISCQGATLYTTTFPCHNCAKHIIAAGIDRVVYVEPYPKSKALDFHTDSAFAGFHEARDEEDRRVAFEPFVGVGPRRFFDLFSMKQGSGFPLKRKDKDTGETLKWDPEDGTMRLPEFPWSYLEREEIAIGIVQPFWRGGDNVEAGRESGEASPSHASEDAGGNAEGG
jgi:deoxycytidylate deaminase